MTQIEEAEGDGGADVTRGAGDNGEDLLVVERGRGRHGVRAGEDAVELSGGEESVDEERKEELRGAGRRSHRCCRRWLSSAVELLRRPQRLTTPSRNHGSEWREFEVDEAAESPANVDLFRSYG